MNYMLEKNGCVYVYQGTKKCKRKEHHCYDVLNGWCMRHGSSYEGRRNAAMKFLHKKQLIPIYVKTDLIVFCTCDVKGRPLWINYVHLAKLTKMENDIALLLFYDGTFIQSAAPYQSIVKQILYTQLWMYAILGKKNEHFKIYVEPADT